jgi:hypothetical protein
MEIWPPPAKNKAPFTTLTQKWLIYLNFAKKDSPLSPCGGGKGEGGKEKRIRHEDPKARSFSSSLRGSPESCGLTKQSRNKDWIAALPLVARNDGNTPSPLVGEGRVRGEKKKEFATKTRRHEVFLRHCEETRNLVG